MFEDSTFESANRIRTRNRGWIVATFIFNSTALLALALFPLLHPEALPRMVNIDLMTVPPQQEATPSRPQQPMPRVLHASEMVGQRLMAPPVIPQTPYAPSTPEPPIISSSGLGEPGANSSSDIGVWSEHRPEPSIRPEPRTKAHVSQGVMDGLLIGRVIPEYPPIAREMHIEGTVILQASISKMGTIENLRVVSGPELLRRAAISAVSQWRYRPYLLNGEPLEVETTVTVTFTLH